MQTFENLEQLWRQQTVVAGSSAPKIAAVQSATARIVRSRGRLLVWGIVVTVLSIFLGQLFTVMNFVNVGRAPTFVGFLHFGVTQVFQIGLLLVLLRRRRAHRALRAKGAASVHENLTASLALIESELRDYRIGMIVFWALLILEFIPIFNGYQQGYYDGAGALHRMLSLAALGGLLFSVALRHRTRVLRPQQQQLTALLGELRQE